MNLTCPPWPNFGAAVAPRVPPMMPVVFGDERARLIEIGLLVPAEVAARESWWLASQPCLTLVRSEREHFERAAARDREIRWGGEFLA